MRLAGRRQVRLRVIFAGVTRSARMCVDEHKNFIGLKDVPAPIAIFRTNRH